MSETDLEETLHKELNKVGLTSIKYDQRWVLALFAIARLSFLVL